MKRKSYLVPIGLLVFLALCLVPDGQAQTTPLPYTNNPAQIALSWNFTAASSATGGFTAAGIRYWQVIFVPSGTVSSCAISIDSSTGSGFSTGGIVPSATIGSCASAGSYANSSATTPTLLGQITPTITGSGSVNVVLLGYVNNPAGSSGGSSSVTVTNFPSTQNVAVTSALPAGANAIGGVSVSNFPATTGTPGSAVPGLATYKGINVAGNLQGATGVSPTSGVYAQQMDLSSMGGTALSPYAVLFNAQAATATATSSAIRAPSQSAAGVLAITGSGITGSPSGCQVAIESQTSVGSPASSAIATISFTPANSYQSLIVAPAPASAAADTLVGVFSCGTYPTAGTITVTFDAFTPTNVDAIGNAAVATAAAGVQKVGITGNGAATIDAAAGATAATNSILAGGVYNSTAPAPSSGQQEPAQFDAAANLRTTYGVVFTTLSAWNSSTSLNTTQTLLANSGVASIILQLDQTTTLTGGAVTIQCTYDSINWSTCPTAYFALTQTIATNPYSVVANTNTAFIIPTLGAVGVRINLTTVITGTGTVTPYVGLLPYPTYLGAFLFGHSGNPLDSTAGGALTSGVLGVAAESQSSGANGASGTSSKMVRQLVDLTGHTFTIAGGSNRFSAAPVSISTNTTTQLEAAPAAGYVAYVTDLMINVTTAGSATTLQLQYGTGTNCGTGTTVLSVTIPDTTAGLIQIHLTEPLVPAAANAVCVTQAGTTAGTASVQLIGYIAP